MQYHHITGTDLNISAVTLGTWVLGGDSWGGAEADKGRDAVLAALDNGINLIDTAPVYGFGRSEEIVGQALANRRDQVLIATKCGLVWKGKKIKIDLSPASVNTEIEASLKRLRTDRIDLYQCHWPDPKTPLEQTMTALARLRDKKMIRHVGVSNFTTGQIRDAQKIMPVVTTQNHYSMLERDVEKELLPYCCENGCAMLTYGPLAGGILTGKYAHPRQFPKDDARSFFYQFYSGDAFGQVQDLLNELKQLKRPLNQIAINWVRQKQGVLSVIVGSRNPAQVRDNASAADWELTREQRQMIDGHLKRL